MKYIEADGNGSCLFISLRLGIELLKILELEKPGVLNGRDRRILKSAEDLREIIVSWYYNGLEKTVDSFGTFNQAGLTLWKREDIIATELHNLSSKDVPESGPDRRKAVLTYLDIMKKSGTWGGTPEYSALALIAKCNIDVYSEGKIVSSIKASENSNKLICLRFSGRNHYDLMITDEQAAKLLSIMPDLRLQDCQDSQDCQDC
jgi:hypothetical protein